MICDYLQVSLFAEQILFSAARKTHYVCVLLFSVKSEPRLSLDSNKKSCAGPVCEYLTGCLDAEDGHPCLRVTLELVDQMDPLWGWDTAVDADITSLEQQRQEDKNKSFFFEKNSPCESGEFSLTESVRDPAMCTADGTPAAHKSLTEKLFFRLISVLLRGIYNTF